MTLSLHETAQFLRISPATVKNWLKAGVLKSTELLHVKQTHQKIKNGKLNKLQKGANKHQSRKVHSHAELLKDKEIALALRPLIEAYHVQKKNLLLAVYLRQLAAQKLVKYNKRKFALSKKLKKEITEWGVPFESSNFLALYEKLTDLKIDYSDNLLSYIYQSANKTSQKQDLGAYYTPISAVQKALKPIVTIGTLCDPCCGSGNFLTEAFLQMQRLKWKNPEALVFGYDCDPLAVLTARANLTLVSGGKIDVINAVVKKDFLLSQPLTEFDYIATNPPWGSFSDKRHKARLMKKFGFLKTKDSFSFFLSASIQNLRRDGTGLFILPLSFMNVGTHAEIRRYLFSNFTVKSVAMLDEKFSGVMTAALLIEIQKKQPAADHLVFIKSNASCHVINSEILESQDCALPVNNDNTSLKVIQEIEKNSAKTLKNQSLWGLGLVTGNNEMFLFDSPAEGRVPVLRGSEVYRYQIPKPEFFCSADVSQFQQAAPLEVFRSKKLVYRFICKELVFTVDTNGLYTLNSANILIPQGKDYSCEVLCAIFNSKLGQYYFTKKYSSIKVLRTHLEYFPLPPVDSNIFKKIESCVLRLKCRYDSQWASEIDELVLKAYKLSELTKADILRYDLNEGFNG